MGGTLASFVLLGGLLLVAGCKDSSGSKVDKEQSPKPGSVTKPETETGKVDNTPGPASKLTFITQPGGGTAGLAWNQQPKVVVQDASGNTVTDSSAEVTLALGANPSQGVLSGTASGATKVRASNGIATFSALSIDKAGEKYTLKASSSDLRDATSNDFDIAHGAAAKLMFTTQPGGAVVKNVFANQPVVEVQDAYGNRVVSGIDAEATLSIELTPSLTPSGRGKLEGTTTATAAKGIASWSNLSVDTPGRYALTVKKPDLRDKRGTDSLSADSGEFTNNSFQIASTSFGNLGVIPSEYKDSRPPQCTGANNFPQLSWSNAPAGTRSFVLIVDDPDGGDWVHLNLYNISSTTTQIPRLLATNGVVDLSPYGKVGTNGWGLSGWAGPCPPEPTHNYHFKIYALSVASISALNNTKRADFESANSASILGSAEIVGVSSP